MLGTAMPMWATRAAESVISPVNITSAREGVEGHGRSTSGGGHRRHVRSGSRAAPRARGGGLLGDVVWPVPHGGAHHGPARWGVPRQAEVREDGRRRKPEDGDALQRAVDSEYSILQGRAPRGHTGGRLSEAGVRAEDPAAHAVAASRRPMRASPAGLMNPPFPIADLTSPQVNRLIHRTRLAFIHLDNLLAFAKRDRDGRVDGYITAHLPDECLLLFFRKGEAVNAASLHTAGRQVMTIGEGLRRMRTEMERGELGYCQAPMEQLAWMYQCCAAPAQPHFVDPHQPAALFPALQAEHVTGVLELISTGRVSYLHVKTGITRAATSATSRRRCRSPSTSNPCSSPGPTARRRCWPPRSRRPSATCPRRRPPRSSTPTASSTGASWTPWNWSSPARRRSARRRGAAPWRAPTRRWRCCPCRAAARRPTRWCSPKSCRWRWAGGRCSCWKGWK